MDRRGFIKGLAGGAVGWLAAGQPAPGGGELAPVYGDPVRFISSAEAAGLPAAAAAAPATAAQQAATYPQSVAAGDPNPNGAVIWTRVAPAAIIGAQRTLGWQIATAATFAAGTVVVQGVAAIQAIRDNTVKLPIQHAALKPFTLYYYRFLYNGIASRTGRFKTMPLPGAALAQIRIGYVTCQDYSNGFYNAHALLAAEEVDVVIHLGDYIYEYLDDGVGGPNNGPVRVVPPFPLGGQYPNGLADYRHLYQTYRSDPQLQAMHERFAMIQLWDDHEFFNDAHQDVHPDTNTPPNTATTHQPALRQAASQAWSEHGLAAVSFDASKNFANAIRLYRSFRFGNLVDVVVTDERLYRDGPPCGNEQFQRYQTLGCAERSNPARTMLGAQQKAWFLDAVTNSTATWKVWANEVMLCQYKIPNFIKPGEVDFFSLDQWDGYPAERADILGQIADAGVKNLVAISGDAHLYLAAYLKTNYDDLAEPPMGVELMVGAISSGNYLDAGVDTPAPLSAPAGIARVAAAGLPMDSLSPIIRAFNPHMAFWNGSTWGYAILTITPTALVCDYRVASTVKSQPAAVQQLARFTVPAGQATLIPG